MNRPGAGLLASCRRTLADWTAPSEEQERLRRDYLTFIGEHPHDGWSRACPSAHLTASSLITSPDASRVVLLLHGRLGRWLQTGGHLEQTDASAEAAALREACEESGLSGLRQDGPMLLLSRHQVPCGQSKTCHHLDLQFLHIADPDDELRLSAESRDLRWFDADDLPDTDDSVRALVSAARRRLAR